MLNILGNSLHLLAIVDNSILLIKILKMLKSVALQIFFQCKNKNTNLKEKYLNISDSFTDDTIEVIIQILFDILRE